MGSTRWLVAFLLVLQPLSFAASANEAPLVLERTIPLAAVSGRIDHLAIDLRRNRLLVAELGNGTVDVVDLATGKVVHRISGLSEPQGVVYVPQSDLIAVASGGDGTVKLFNGADFSTRGVFALGDDADNARVDPSTGHVVVGYGSGGLATIDPATARKIADVQLSDHPEGFGLSSSTPRIFVNVPDAHEIDVIDSAAGKIIGRWRPPKLAANFPMALDDAHRLIAVAFRSPAHLALLDGASGRVLSDVNACGDADDVYFDLKRDRIYESCGAGAIAVFHVSDGRLQPLAQIPTQAGARTSLFVPDLDRLFLAARAGWFGSPASIQIFRPDP